ncbi:heavy-metal-associated domain-containing protein [Salinivirga cyanobacteriivorans]
MRPKFFVTILFIMASATALLAGEKNLKLKVYGNCGMCETRIEKAAESVDGVTEASWDKSTKMLEVTMSDNVDEMTIHNAIAKAGHDTQKAKADDATYSDLPGCCKYDREAKKSGSDCKTPCKKAKKKECDKS